MEEDIGKDDLGKEVDPKVGLQVDRGKMFVRAALYVAQGASVIDQEVPLGLIATSTFRHRVIDWL